MGKIIAIEGLDGCGKETQTQLLKERLSDLTEDNIYTVSFPSYGRTSSVLVTEYLNGRIQKDPNKVNPIAAASFYALDRYISYETQWKKWYDNNESIIIMDRYTTSNVLHQTHKLKTKEERIAFAKWIYDYEWDMLKLPKPDIEIFLSVPFDRNLKLLQGRKDLKDLHENVSYQKSCYDCFLEIKHNVLNDINIINCSNEEGDLLNPNVISDSIIQLLGNKEII